MNDRQRDYSMPRGSAHRGIKMCFICLLTAGAWLFAVSAESSSLSCTSYVRFGSRGTRLT